MKTREERRADFFSLVARIGSQPGHLATSVRGALVARRTGEIPAGLAPLAERIRERASTVTDEEVEKARRAGYDDDQLFELTVGTALGESARRFRRVLDLLGRS